MKVSIFSSPVRSFLKPVNCAALLLATLALSACGGSSTSIVEQDPIEHGHGSGVGRLLISEKNHDHVYVFDLEHEEIIEEFHLDGVPTALYASPSYRIGIVVRGGSQGQVNFVDGGIYLEEHGDHFDLIEQAPRLLDLELLGVRPAHVNGADGRVAIFFDGDDGVPAEVQVFTEHGIRHEAEPALLSYSTNQHGAMQVRGEYLLSTIRTPGLLPETTLPTRVALYHLHDNEYEFEEEFDIDCPGLHGSAQNHDFVAFGCSDGVLIIEEDNHGDHGHFEARKVAFEQRIGTLFGHRELAVFVGVSSGNLYVVNPEGEGSIEPILWTEDATLSPVGYAFAEDGELFLVLDNKGGLTALHTHDWDVEGERLQVTGSETALEGSRFELTVSGDGHFAYVSDPTAGEVKVVDVEDMEVVDTIVLDFTPHKIVWLGAAEAGEAHHH